jgi:serine/threonine protein kinase/Flp pilus assembly protein TadD
MAKVEATPTEGAADRAEQIRRVVLECIRRRDRGESLPDDRVIAEHSELMPELAEELRKLALIQAARRRAEQDGDDPKPCGLPDSGECGDWAWARDLPGYRILERIHDGGQGIIYRAIQKSTGRPVAIKVLREGPFADPRDRARFDRELHILAQLNHPNIIAIRDSGMAAGHFYHVMDLIPGQPLDAYLAADKLALRDRLHLFLKIADAVHAAHLHGVIHRDLKPANIGVNADGEPFILDFGLAKQTEAPPGDGPSATMTVTGQLIGSLPWTSPEQAEGQPRKVDVRTDVYALGLILYHMLAGRFPYPVVGNVRDVVDNILTAEPIRPHVVRPEIDDELETITLKCLQKDRERRYQSAGELARDIRRYLTGEPIEAKRDSGWYVFRKTVRRYRLHVGLATAFVVLISAVSVALFFLYRQAQHQAAAARAARDEAQEEAHVSQQVTKFLVNLFEVSDPETARGQTVTARELLDEGARKITLELKDEPATQARLMNTMGCVYQKLGLFDAALPLLEEALRIRRELFGDEHIAVAESLHDLGRLQIARGQFDEAERLLRLALAVRQSELGADHPDVGSTLIGLASTYVNRGHYAQAEPLYREALVISRRALAPDDPQLARATHELATFLWLTDRYSEAEPLMQETLRIYQHALGNEHPKVADAIGNLGALADRVGDYQSEEAYFRQALAIRRAFYPEDHPAVLAALSASANALMRKGQRDEAIALAEQVVATAEQTFGTEHPQLALYLLNLGYSCYVVGQYDKAETSLVRALAILRKAQPEHSRIATALNCLGRIRLRQGRPVEAEFLLRECLETSRQVSFPSGDWLIARFEAGLAESLLDQGRFEEAEAELLSALAVLEENPVGDDLRRDVLITNRDVQRLFVRLYETSGKPDQAAEWRAKLEADSDPSRTEVVKETEAP